MTVNDCKSYFPYSNKLVYEYNNYYVRVTKYKKVFSKSFLKIGQGKYLLSIDFWKLILGLINLIWTEKKIIGGFYKKEL